MTITMISRTRIERNPFHESAMRPRRIPAMTASLSAGISSLSFLDILIIARMKKARRNAVKANSFPLENTDELMGSAMRA